MKLLANGLPLMFFDLVCEEVETAKITADDFAYGYKATEHLIQQGCKNISVLPVFQSLFITD